MASHNLKPFSEARAMKPFPGLPSLIPPTYKRQKLDSLYENIYGVVMSPQLALSVTSWHNRYADQMTIKEMTDQVENLKLLSIFWKCCAVLIRRTEKSNDVQRRMLLSRFWGFFATHLREIEGKEGEERKLLSAEYIQSWRTKSWMSVTYRVPSPQEISLATSKTIGNPDNYKAAAAMIDAWVGFIGEIVEQRLSKAG